MIYMTLISTTHVKALVLHNNGFFEISLKIRNHPMGTYIPINVKPLDWICWRKLRCKKGFV